MSARTYRALIIANSTFPNDSQNLIELEGPRNDPALLRDALCDRATGLFANDNVRLTLERTMAEVLREVEDFLRSASRQDTVLLYYSGHGMLDQSGELYLCTRDSRIDRLRSTAVKASDIRGMMDDSSAASTVVVLDCCHSGRFKSGGDVSAALSGRGRFVITSSRSGELANDAHVRNHASLFTHHLVEGLLAGAPDHDGDGVVTLSEIYDYIHGRLGEEGKQVPQKRFEGDGDVPMALRTAVAADEPPPNPQEGLLDPALVAPVLDVSESNIDLGEIDADEELPPERIAVINRGGGSLEWTVECTAPWVTPMVEDHVVVLHLRPEPGPNRANVYVVDTLTGAQKTVRLSVRVRPAPTPPIPVPVDRSPTTEGELVTADTTLTAGSVSAEPTSEQEIGPAQVVADRGDESAPETEYVPIDEVAAAVEALSPDTVDPVVVTGDPDEHAGPAEASTAVVVTATAKALDPRAVSRTAARIAPVILAACGVAFFVLASDTIEDIRNIYGKELLLRNDGLPGAPGLLPLVFGGASLVVAGLAALVRPVREVAAPAASVTGVATGLAALTEAASVSEVDSSVMSSGWIAFWSLLAILLGLAWPVHALLSPRSPERLPLASVAIATVAALAWGVGSAVRGYDCDCGLSLGSMSDLGGGFTHFLLAVATVAAVLLALRVGRASGAGLLLGASIIPLFVAIAEIWFRLSTDSTYIATGGPPWLVAVPAAVLLATAVWSLVSVVRHRTPRKSTLPAVDTALA